MAQALVIPDIDSRTNLTQASSMTLPANSQWRTAGPGTNGSQFFITHGPTPHLDGAHSVFGSVDSATDQDIVDSIAQGDTILSVDDQW